MLAAAAGGGSPPSLCLVTLANVSFASSPLWSGSFPPITSPDGSLRAAPEAGRGEDNEGSAEELAQAQAGGGGGGDRRTAGARAPQLPPPPLRHSPPRCLENAPSSEQPARPGPTPDPFMPQSHPGPSLPFPSSQTAEQKANARREAGRLRAAMRVILLSHVARLLKAGLPGILAMATLVFVGLRVGLVAAAQVGAGALVSWLASFFLTRQREGAGLAEAAVAVGGGGETSPGAAPAVAAA